MTHYVESLTIFASAARTATVNGSDIINDSHRGANVVIDCTADPSTASVTFTVQGKDETSGKYYTILESAAVNGTGTTVLRVYPGIAASSNVAVSEALPRIWRVIATHADSESITYSVGASLLI